ncbi:unnamed protein product [Ectocarpus sp. 6 AP-2014]
MTKILLGSGADVKSVDRLGYTALHWAAFDGIQEVVHSLVEVGADVEARCLAQLLSEKRHSLKGSTPLHVAAYWETLDAMLALLEKGANANAPDDDGHGPLHLICKYPKARSVAVADLLLRWGAEETATDNDGNTPADFIQSGDEFDGRLQRLLANAPAGRAWRRRGMVIMLRAQGVEASNAAPVDRACRRRGRCVPRMQTRQTCPPGRPGGRSTVPSNREVFVGRREERWSGVHCGLLMAARSL